MAQFKNAGAAFNLPLLLFRQKAECIIGKLTIRVGNLDPACQAAERHMAVNPTASPDHGRAERNFVAGPPAQGAPLCGGYKFRG